MQKGVLVLRLAKDFYCSKKTKKTPKRCHLLFKRGEGNTMDQQQTNNAHTFHQIQVLQKLHTYMKSSIITFDSVQ